MCKYWTSQKKLIHILLSVLLFLQRRTFFDKLRIHARAGAGGQGFQKYGGIGGKGGDVIVRAQTGARFETLLELTPDRRYTAGSGKDSS